MRIENGVCSLKAEDVPLFATALDVSVPDLYTPERFYVEG